MTYRVLADAQRDLESIDDWLVENFGPSFADRTQSRLCDAFELLTRFPQMGRPRPEIDRRPVHFFHLRPYWIVYQPAVPLLIHRVYHAARDLNRLNLE